MTRAHGSDTRAGTCHQVAVTTHHGQHQLGTLGTGKRKSTDCVGPAAQGHAFLARAVHTSSVNKGRKTRAGGNSVRFLPFPSSPFPSLHTKSHIRKNTPGYFAGLGFPLLGQSSPRALPRAGAGVGEPRTHRVSRVSPAPASGSSHALGPLTDRAPLQLQLRAQRQSPPGYLGQRTNG